jgi:hypothetical protein
LSALSALERETGEADFAGQQRKDQSWSRRKTLRAGDDSLTSTWRNIYANKIDEMIDDQYTPDATLISPLRRAENATPSHRARQQGAQGVFSHVYRLAGRDPCRSALQLRRDRRLDFFQAIFTSNTGRWVVVDAWQMRNDKIDVLQLCAQDLIASGTFAGGRSGRALRRQRQVRARPAATELSVT